MGCSVPNGQPREIHASNIIWTQQVILGNIYVYTYMHAIATSEERGHEFEG